MAFDSKKLNAYINLSCITHHVQYQKPISAAKWRLSGRPGMKQNSCIVLGTCMNPHQSIAFIKFLC